MKFNTQSSKFKVVAIAALLVVFAVVSGVYAETKLEVGIPGQKVAGQSVTGPVEYIKYIYLFTLGFVGIAGFISLVMWGVVWTASSVIDKKAAAMDGIQNALTGIAIAFTAFIILNTINPDLTVIKAPTVSTVMQKYNPSKPTPIDDLFDVKGGEVPCKRNSDCAVFGPAYLCRNYKGIVQCIAPRSSLEKTSPSTAQTVNGVAACCFNPAPMASYRWACIGENELTSTMSGCSRVFGEGWQTFTATTQGCIDQIQSIGPAPQC